jgi:glycerophosphoryl diester phosphodiesterase
MGKRIFTYTLNHPDDISDALNCGVDGFFTDDPVLGLRSIGITDYNE